MTVLLHPFAAAAQTSPPGVRVDSDTARLLRRTLVDHASGVRGVSSAFLASLAPVLGERDASRLSEAIERVAATLEDPDRTRRRLLELADLLGALGISPRDCARAKLAFLGALRDALGERWTTDIEREWVVALDLLARLLLPPRAQA